MYMYKELGKVVPNTTNDLVTEIHDEGTQLSGLKLLLHGIP